MATPYSLAWVTLWLRRGLLLGVDFSFRLPECSGRHKEGRAVLDRKYEVGGGTDLDPSGEPPAKPERRSRALPASLLHRIVYGGN